MRVLLLLSFLSAVAIASETSVATMTSSGSNLFTGKAGQRTTLQCPGQKVSVKLGTAAAPPTCTGALGELVIDFNANPDSYKVVLATSKGQDRYCVREFVSGAALNCSVYELDPDP